MLERQKRLVHLVLTALVILDTTLVIWAFALPDLWFWAFHGLDGGPELAELFLRRCGANWTAFLLFQAVAWKRWRAEPAWLAVVAGVRWSDIFTDPTYALLSTDATWFTWATLPLMGATNFALGLFLFRSFLASRDTAPRADRGPGDAVELTR